MLTNGGMLTELQKANKDNKTLGYEIGSECSFKKEHLVLCHTPLGEPHIIDKYKDNFVLCVGPRGTQLPLAENYKIHKYISIDELAALNPEVSFFVQFEYTHDMLAEHKSTLL